VGGQLLRMTADGAEPILPENQLPLRDPVFADDGRLAAVHREQSYDIILVDPDGGKPECVVCETPKVGWGTLGSDGAVVFLHWRGEDRRVLIRDPEGRQRPLTGTDEAASCPVLSPDSTRVAYLAQVEGTTELRVRPRDGGEPVTLARDLEVSEFVSWSPDGGSIAYAGGSPLRVWVVSAAGGKPRSVSGPGGDYPSWSPDGSRIAFTIWTEESDPDQGTWVVASDGSEARKISDHPSRVVWDPASGRLLQLRKSAVDGALELWQATADGWRWSLRSRLNLGARPPAQMEFRPLTIDPVSGRLVMNRLKQESRLVVFEGIDVNRW